MMCRFPVARRTLALVVSAVVCTIALAALAAPGAFADGQRQAAPRETAPECLSKLRKLVAAVAVLDRLADDVKDGNVYLFFDNNVFSPVDKKLPKTTERVTDALILVMTGEFDLGVQFEKRAKASTAKNLKRLLLALERGHELVRAREKRCNTLKSGGGAPAAGSFKLVGQVDAAKDIKNPNAIELKIEAQDKRATNIHPVALGGGQWTVEYTWKLPETLTPGKTSKVLLKIDVKENPGQSTFALSVSAPGLNEQLQGKDTVQREYEFTVPEGSNALKDLTIGIRMLSAEVIYHYQR